MGYEPSWWEYVFFFGPGIMTGLGVFAGVFFGVTLALKRRDAASRPLEKTSPMDVVRERYARGEISRSEYERLRDDLDDADTTRQPQSRPVFGPDR